MNTSVHKLHIFTLNRIELLLLFVLHKNFIEMYLYEYLEMYLEIIRI